MQEEATQLLLLDNGSISAEHSRCFDCHRKLKTPGSRATGRGPVCQRKHQAQQAFAEEARAKTAAAAFENSVNIRERVEA